MFFYCLVIQGETNRISYYLQGVGILFEGGGDGYIGNEITLISRVGLIMA